MSLKILIPENEDLWDEVHNKFISVKETSLVLEHSLVSIKKWESKWHKPFLKEGFKPTEVEMLDYIRCMTLNQNVDPNAYYALTDENILEIKAYIEDPMTATNILTIGNKRPQKKETMTAELIYYYMFANGIPLECQKWHLNSLLTLLQVFGVKNTPEKEKMNKKDTAAYYAALNKARKAKHHTKG